MVWSDDDELFTLMRTKLFTAVVGDILDEMGFLHQFLPREIQPLSDAMETETPAETLTNPTC